MLKPEILPSVDNISPEILSNEALFLPFIGELFQTTKAADHELASSIQYVGMDTFPEFKALKSRLEKLNETDPTEIPDHLNVLEPCLKSASRLIKSKFKQKLTGKNLFTQSTVEQILVKMADFMRSMKQFQKSLITLLNKME